MGLTEAQARDTGEVVVASVPFADLDRAIIDGHTEGFCKLIVSQAGAILGAHVVGEQAVEIVQIVAAAMAAGVPVTRLALLELSYPTFTGIVGLAAREALRALDRSPPLPGWGALGRPAPAEWERSER